MLQEQPNQFGIQFTQDSPGIGGAPFINPSVLLPQLIEQLHLPPLPQEHQCFLEAQQVSGSISEQHRPGGQFPGSVPDRLASPLRIRFQIGASPPGHFFRNPEQE